MSLSHSGEWGCWPKAQVSPEHMHRALSVPSSPPEPHTLPVHSIISKFIESGAGSLGERLRGEGMELACGQRGYRGPFSEDCHCAGPQLHHLGDNGTFCQLSGLTELISKIQSCVGFHHVILPPYLQSCRNARAAHHFLTPKGNELFNLPPPHVSSFPENHQHLHPNICFRGSTILEIFLVLKNVLTAGLPL